MRNAYDLETGWFGGDGNPYTYREIKDFLLSIGHKLEEIHIGTDSHLVSGRFYFATALCIKPPYGGHRYFICRREYPGKTFPTLRLRLHKECHLSVQLACELRTLLGENAEIIVHSDLNASPAHKSNACTKELTNYIKAMGFPALIKPEAWASCSVADKHAR